MNVRKLVELLYEEGLSYKEIARRLRMSLRDVTLILKRGGELDELKGWIGRLEVELRELQDAATAQINLLDARLKKLETIAELITKGETELAKLLAESTEIVY